jgi:putative sugar O-methyltransferase
VTFGARSSLSDEDAYLEVCAGAARDPRRLRVFKSDPHYVRIVEHVTCEQGAAYLQRAIADQPWLAERLPDFRRNDDLGSPRRCDYGEHGLISPTTLRYVKVLADLAGLFGSLEGMRIVEIGAGYGGQCVVISRVATPASYVLVDLEQCLALQRSYLAELGVEAEFMRADDLPADADYDLVVSNYAFSECNGRVQRHYRDRVLTRALRGYVTMNWINPAHFRSLGRDELGDALPGARWLPEEPRTAPANEILVWGTSIV